MALQTIQPDAADYRVARYAAAAIALSIAEAAIPTPLPGVKPGLANIVVLLVLMRHGWSEAAWVAVLRVFAASLLLGQIFAPGFFLSLSGSVLSLAALALAQHLPRRWFGAVSLSLIAAFAHIGGQMLLARVWLVPHEGLWALWPVFSATATLFGLINGLITAKLLGEPQVASRGSQIASGESRVETPDAP
jgi:heptaprenyl diphosphate synthase